MSCIWFYILCINGILKQITMKKKWKYNVLCGNICCDSFSSRTLWLFKLPATAVCDLCSCMSFGFCGDHLCFSLPRTYHFLFHICNTLMQWHIRVTKVGLLAVFGNPSLYLISFYSVNGLKRSHRLQFLFMRRCLGCDLLKKKTPAVSWISHNCKTQIALCLHCSVKKTSM